MPQPPSLPPYRFRDLGAVVDEVVSRHVLRAGDALLVLVREPSRAQAVERVSRVRGGRWRALDQPDRSRLIERTVDAMPVPEWTRGDDPGPRHSVLTVAARRGFTVPGRDELAWFYAWRYAHCFARVYTGEFVLVTEHGRCDLTSQVGAATPFLAA